MLPKHRAVEMQQLGHVSLRVNPYECSTTLSLRLSSQCCSTHPDRYGNWRSGLPPSGPRLSSDIRLATDGSLSGTDDCLSNSVGCFPNSFDGSTLRDNCLSGTSQDLCAAAEHLSHTVECVPGSVSTVERGLSGTRQVGFSLPLA